MEDRVKNMSNYENQTWLGSKKNKWKEMHWWDFKHQNKLVLEAFKKSSLRYDIIDAYEINILRPDLHRDGLHSCFPGKMDIYNQLLLHFLRGNK